MAETQDDLRAAANAEASALQFERAEFDGGPAAATCASCQAAIQGSYWSLRGQTLCGNCKHAVEQALVPGSVFTAVPRALVFGLAGGLVGSVVWYLVAHFLDMHIGLIAILIGYLAGMGVNKAVRGRGGVGYQVMAALITYACICFAFAPDVAQSMATPPDGANPADFQPLPALLRWPIAAVLSLGIPFMGFLSPISLLIGGFGIWEAVRRNKRVDVVFEGPFLLAPSSAVAAAAAVATPSSSPPGSGEPLL